MKFQDYPPRKKNVSSDTLYADVANHCDDWSYYGGSSDMSTNAHEATHGINNQIRNAFRIGYSFVHHKLGKDSVIKPTLRDLTLGVNGFYVLKNRAVTIPEPACKKHDIIPFIHAWFRKTRYSLYVAGQSDWDSCPLYIYDEWTAYINQAIVAEDLLAKGLYKDGNQDITYGAVEFVAYGLALCMAADKVNALSDLLREFTRFQIRRAFNAYYVGRGKWPFGEDEIVAQLLDGTEGQTYRDFCHHVLCMGLPRGVVDEEVDVPYPHE